MVNELIENSFKLCSNCKQSLPAEEFSLVSITRTDLRTWCKKCYNIKTTISRRKLKQEMVNAYGGKCTCCGESHIEFLSLEHVNRDGAKSRAEHNKIAHSYWKMLKTQGWPKDKYTVLCVNCNFATKNGKPCPHKKDEYEKYMRDKFGA